MTRTVVARGPEVDALLTLLRSDGAKVGDSEKPEGGGHISADGTSSFVPYAVLYPGPVDDWGGPVSDPEADSAATYQLTCVGISRAGADWLADRLMSLLASGVLDIADRAVDRIERQPGTRHSGRDDDVNPPQFFAAETFTVRTTPE